MAHQERRWAEARKKRNQEGRHVYLKRLEADRPSFGHWCETALWRRETGRGAGLTPSVSLCVCTRSEGREGADLGVTGGHSALDEGVGRVLDFHLHAVERGLHALLHAAPHASAHAKSGYGEVVRHNSCGASHGAQRPHPAYSESALPATPAARPDPGGKIEWGLLHLDVEVEEVEDDGLIRTCFAGGSTLGLRV